MWLNIVELRKEVREKKRLVLDEALGDALDEFYLFLKHNSGSVVSSSLMEEIEELTNTYGLEFYGEYYLSEGDYNSFSLSGDDQKAIFTMLVDGTQLKLSDVQIDVL